MTQTLVLLSRVSRGLKRNLHNPARPGVLEKSGNNTTEARIRNEAEG